jgi:hypothetical protein
MDSKDEFLLELAGQAMALANVVNVTWPMMTPEARAALHPISERVKDLCDKVPAVLQGDGGK